MSALCFKCGNHKTGALKLCSKCDAIPETKEEKVLSLCLSLECVTQQTLKVCQRHFEKKQRAPRFKDVIVERATKCLEEQIESGTDNSIMFSASVFDFSDLIEEKSTIRKQVTAHIIGKGPKQDTADANASFGKAHKTYHRSNWVIGNDISEEKYESNKGPHGDVYVWYRWLNNQWSWSCISHDKFEQLKAVESGRLGS